ncbi:hypothetical protein A1Q1_03269 [Trichosporon asahii var. asahii CBS 2479]|uniref:Uncharacterized protein n=1 Tax=Trichosporon asahii var. asahii (strain ATCC 90039 / CBS 2479 / JCM 2466 / KCTC 7840 / NBRC 103889/ NCYC 2677 / UAMH 7654) TaxID=1186058 RepID=J5QKC7_TRIAS|nr:hypothetical protein A1Q1_03269 [Trichosporon asahii var. asahii CBS 2479]EJT47808.1 hypothetical protein A1Q1_03269 [Trichosporon asahii var. asahii CBS 2479]
MHSLPSSPLSPVNLMLTFIIDKDNNPRWILLFLTQVLAEDWRTILGMRAVCKDWYSFISPLAYGHLLISPDDVDETAVIVKPLTMALPPALRRIKPDQWVSQHLGYKFTAFTYALSIVGFIPPTCSLPLLREAFPNLELLRMMPDIPGFTYLPYVPFNSWTLALFPSRSRGSNTTNTIDASSRRVVVQQPTFRPGHYDIAHRWTARRDRLLPANFRRSLASNIERIVVHSWNLNCLPDLEDMYNLPKSLFKHLREIVFAVPMYHKSGLTILPFVHAWSLERAVGNLARVLTLPQVQFTIVGLEDIKVESCEDQFREALFKALWTRDQAGQHRPKQSFDDIAHRYAKVSEVMSRVRTVTLEEYIGETERWFIAVSELEGMLPLEIDYTDEGGFAKDVLWDVRKEYPHHTEFPETGCSADRLFEYIAENGLL